MKASYDRKLHLRNRSLSFNQVIHLLVVHYPVLAEEAEKVGEWMWNNRASYTGLSVLPYNGGSYKQAPFEDCTEEEFVRLFDLIREVDLKQVLELEDDTDLQGELACAGGSCVVT